MDSKKLNKILAVLLGAALIYIIILQGCGSGSNGSGEVIYRDTVKYEAFIDTIWLPTEDTIYKYITVKVPKPYFDTTYVVDTIQKYTIEDFEDFIARPQIYEDTISDDTVSIYYKAVVWGYMEDIKLGYKPEQQYTIVETRTLETNTTKVKQPLGLYIGLDAAANAGGLTHLAPMVELATAKMTYNAGYDLNDQSFVIGARARINFRKRQKSIPRP